MTKKLLVALGAVASLVLALHFTGDAARGQSAGNLVALDANGGPIFAVDAAGNIYSGEGCFGNLRPFVRIGQLPAGRTPTCMGSWYNGQAIFIGCSNGDVYTFSPNSTPLFTPDFCGNIL